MNGLRKQFPNGRRMLTLVISSVVLFSCSKNDLQDTSELGSKLLNETSASASSSSNLAFPGATGFAKSTRGAYAKYDETNNTADLPRVIYVDNLSDGGEGSLRAAL